MFNSSAASSGQEVCPCSGGKGSNCSAEQDLMNNFNFFHKRETKGFGQCHCLVTTHQGSLNLTEENTRSRKDDVEWFMSVDNRHDGEDRSGKKCNGKLLINVCFIYAYEFLNIHGDKGMHNWCALQKMGIMVHVQEIVDVLCQRCKKDPAASRSLECSVLLEVLASLCRLAAGITGHSL